MKPEFRADGTVLEEFDSLQLLSEIVFLVLEARSPAHSLKGRTEGLHCRIPRSHQCHMSHDECIRAGYFREKIDIMWKNSIPPTIDIILFPGCLHGSKEAGLLEGDRCEMDGVAILLERWHVQYIYKPYEDWRQRISGTSLMMAIRSHLHFSQLSAWQASMGSHRLPFHAAYRLYAPGEEGVIEFREVPQSHTFPTGVYGPHGLKVVVQSRARSSSPPIVPCFLCQKSSQSDESTPSTACPVLYRTRQHHDRSRRQFVSHSVVPLESCHPEHCDSPSQMSPNGCSASTITTPFISHLDCASHDANGRLTFQHPAHFHSSFLRDLVLAGSLHSSLKMKVVSSETSQLLATARAVRSLPHNSKELLATAVRPLPHSPTELLATLVGPLPHSPKELLATAVRPLPHSPTELLTTAVRPLPHSPKELFVTAVRPNPHSPKELFVTAVRPLPHSPKELFVTAVRPNPHSPKELFVTAVRPLPHSPKELFVTAMRPLPHSPKELLATAVRPLSHSPKELLATAVRPLPHSPKELFVTAVRPNPHSPKELFVTAMRPLPHSPKELLTTAMRPLPHSPKELLATAVRPLPHSPKELFVTARRSLPHSPKELELRWNTLQTPFVTTTAATSLRTTSGTNSYVLMSQASLRTKSSAWVKHLKLGNKKRAISVALCGDDDNANWRSPQHLFGDISRQNMLRFLETFPSINNSSLLNFNACQLSSSEAQCSEAQCSEAQCSEAQCSEAQCSEAQCSEAPCSDALYSHRHPICSMQGIPNAQCLSSYMIYESSAMCGIGCFHRALSMKSFSRPPLSIDLNPFLDVSVFKSSHCTSFLGSNVGYLDLLHFSPTSALPTEPAGHPSSFNKSPFACSLENKCDEVVSILDNRSALPSAWQQIKVSENDGDTIDLPCISSPCEWLSLGFTPLCPHTFSVNAEACDHPCDKKFRQGDLIRKPLLCPPSPVTMEAWQQECEISPCHQGLSSNSFPPLIKNGGSTLENSAINRAHSSERVHPPFLASRQQAIHRDVMGLTSVSPTVDVDRTACNAVLSSSGQYDWRALQCEAKAPVSQSLPFSLDDVSDGIVFTCHRQTALQQSHCEDSCNNIPCTFHPPSPSSESLTTLSSYVCMEDTGVSTSQPDSSLDRCLPSYGDVTGLLSTDQKQSFYRHQPAEKVFKSAHTNSMNFEWLSSGNGELLSGSCSDSVASNAEGMLLAKVRNDHSFEGFSLPDNNSTSEDDLCSRQGSGTDGGHVEMFSETNVTQSVCPPTRNRSLPSLSLLTSTRLNGQQDKDLSKTAPVAQDKIFKDHGCLRRRLAKSASQVFNVRGSFPSQSSPVPVKRNMSCRFDFDDSLTTTKAIKNALSMSQVADPNSSQDNGSVAERFICSNAPSAANCLLGNFEESMLNGRLEPVGVVGGFTVNIAASGSFCPRHINLPVTAYFFSFSEDNAPSPYLGHVDLESVGKRGYRIPIKGTLQVTLLNPNKMVVKVFVVVYDFQDIPPNCQTVVRQRTLYLPVKPKSTLPSYLRYLIHLRICSSSSSKVYLHTDMRLIFARNKFELEGNVEEYELRSFTDIPTDPKYSPTK